MASYKCNRGAYIFHTHSVCCGDVLVAQYLPSFNEAAESSALIKTELEFCACTLYISLEEWTYGT